MTRPSKPEFKAYYCEDCDEYTDCWCGQCHACMDDPYYD